ncbi:unnamed protein product, partial [Tetraodon nigroviridis]
KREGGNPAEADQLLPAVEEEVLQTARKDPLLRQRLQGRKSGGSGVASWADPCPLLRLQSLIFDEVDLSDASVAETSTKNINNSFTVITPFRKLMLCAESRKEMEDWIGTVRSVQKWETYEV